MKKMLIGAFPKLKSEKSFGKSCRKKEALNVEFSIIVTNID